MRFVQKFHGSFHYYVNRVAKINKLVTHNFINYMQAPDLKKITIDKIDHPLLNNKNVQLDVLRLDKIHPVISGNKWFKLKYHLDNFNAGNYKGIITVGGAWSNHIVATACMCYLLKIKCIGIIRGEKPAQFSKTLHEAVNYGMQLKFISRDEYKKVSGRFGETGKIDFPGHYIIPEGGSGEVGERGASEIMRYADGNNYTHIACAVGTGTTLRGISKSISKDQKLFGVVVLKGWNEDGQNGNAKLLLNYHFGGYAKYDGKLLGFMNEFYQATSIPTDFVYTGKLAFAIFDLIKRDHFNECAKILMIHSGGLQGNRSLQKGSLIF
jgi:1-aminocyclopropane-1-carboxylate deaminase/D-cysteine desulfhydrase-like pyridoxal-dependent ACC family enzyme